MKVVGHPSARSPVKAGQCPEDTHACADFTATKNHPHRVGTGRRSGFIWRWKTSPPRAWGRGLSAWMGSGVSVASARAWGRGEVSSRWFSSGSCFRARMGTGMEPVFQTEHPESLPHAHGDGDD